MTPPLSKIEQCLTELPKTLKIGAYDWAIQFQDGAEENCGEADFETRQLSLWSANLTSPGHAVGIVLHECLHVIFDNEGLEQLKRGKEEREEQIIAGFEAGLVSLLRDNLKLISWMKKWLR